jgi:hypothetical protein
MEIISTLSCQHIETYINNKNNDLITFAIPRNCQTFHQFLPSKYINVKRNGKRLFSPFLFQCFYFGYTNKIDKTLSKPNKNYNDVQVILKLVSDRDVYIIDIFQATQYLNQIKEQNKFILDEHRIEYYNIIAQTFKEFKDCTKEELSSYKDIVYLLQREIQFDKEIVKIRNDEYQQILVNDINKINKRYEMVLETKEQVKGKNHINKLKGICSVL